MCGFLLAWALLLFMLAAAVYGMAGNGELLARKMLAYAPPETTGLPEKEYPAVGRMTADYLTGREELFQHTFSDAEGNTYLCFQPHEQAHMADCRELILLAGTLRLVFGAAVFVLAGAGFLCRRSKLFAKSILAGLGAAGILCSVILLWAAIDFDSFFTAFHRLAFTNDGWLLDPRTDLLIRLMPADFFMALGARLVLWMLAAAAAAGMTAWLIIKRRNGSVSQETL